MDLKELKSLFGLEGIPWVSLLGSALGLSLLASLRFGTGHPSESVLWLLTLIGIDASAGVAAVHGWFVDPLRNDVLTEVCNISLLLAGVAYARCYWRELDSDEKVTSAGRSLAATRDSLYRKDSPATREEKESLVEQARKDFAAVSRHEFDVRSWCVARMVRLAQVAWILLAILAEAGWLSLPFVMLWGVGFVAVLAVIEVSKAEPGDRLMGLVSAVFFFGMSILASLVTLPVFLVSRITSPPSPQKTAKAKDQDSAE